MKIYLFSVHQDMEEYMTEYILYKITGLTEEAINFLNKVASNNDLYVDYQDLVIEGVSTIVSDLWDKIQYKTKSEICVFVGEDNISEYITCLEKETKNPITPVEIIVENNNFYSMDLFIPKKRKGENEERDENLGFSERVKYRSILIGGTLSVRKDGIISPKASTCLNLYEYKNLSG
ncbi:MAG: hypothetical protein ACI88L_000515 [Candidatus Paceibacteria bacterium]|jgi:hypothetical protein